MRRCDEPPPYNQPYDLRDSDELDCAAQWDKFHEAEQLPKWAFPMLFIIIVFASWVLHEAVEQPLSRLLVGQRTTADNIVRRVGRKMWV